MLVIIADKLPNKIRGLLKLWCIEPKPHVFISDISKRIENKIINFIKPYLYKNYGILIIRSNKKNMQGFELYGILKGKKEIISNLGLLLIQENHNI